MTDEKTYTFEEIEAAARAAVLNAESLELLRQRLERAGTPPAPRFGIYNDLGPTLSLRHAGETAGLGLDEEAIMIESSRVGFDPRWTPEQLMAYHALSPERLKVLTVWPDPTRVWFDEFTARIGRFLGACPVFALDLDLEMRMKRQYVEGFSDIEDFGRALMAFLRGVKDEGLIREIQTDTFPGHREAHGSDAVDGEDMQYIQSYSIAKEGRTWLGRFGRDRAAKDYRFLRDRKDNDELLSVVLAAWGQAGWGQANPASAMAETAYSAGTFAAATAGYERLRWWSLKHCVGPKANSYAAGGIRRSIDVIKEARGW